MNIPWEGLPHIQNFLQLNFLFSGLEVSSSSIFAARIAALLVFGGGLLWALYRIIMKSLDCLQTLFTSVGPIPKSFFLLLLLVIPLSPASVGDKWLGYLLFALLLIALVTCAALALVLWRYGVDQALRLINSIRHRNVTSGAVERESTLPPDNIIRPETEPAGMRAEAARSAWSPVG